MKRGTKPGCVSNKVDAKACQVAGCNKRALYKNPTTKIGDRGYCSDHKALAVPSVRSVETSSRTFATWISQ